MKTLISKVGILLILLIGMVFEEASAAAEWSSKCPAVKPSQNPSFQHINCLLTNAALDADIPPEVVKAVAYQESDWLQFKNGKPNVSGDGGIGIMQITTKPKGYEDVKKLETDIVYNIAAGVSILKEKYTYKLPKIKGAQRHQIENWYFPVMAYNGTKAVNAPIYQKNGLINTGAYQEKVFARIKADSLLGEGNLAQLPFKVDHFSYDKNHNINFAKTEYTVTAPLRSSNYSLKKGDQVIVIGGTGNLRAEPTTSGTNNKLAPKNTVLKITGTFSYDKNSASKNQFVWFPVKTMDGKSKGHIASAYIQKHTDKIPPPLPVVHTVTDKATVLTGKAETNATVYAKAGTKILGKAIAKNGAFSINISKQKAGTGIVVYAMDPAGNKSLNKTVKVIDKTPPAAPAVNKISSKTVSVTGKGEKGAAIYVYNGSKKIGQGTVDNAGKFKVKIKAQKKGTTLHLYLKDKAGNQSAKKSLKVG